MAALVNTPSGVDVGGGTESKSWFHENSGERLYVVAMDKLSGDLDTGDLCVRSLTLRHEFKGRGGELQRRCYGGFTRVLGTEGGGREEVDVRKEVDVTKEDDCKQDKEADVLKEVAGEEEDKEDDVSDEKEEDEEVDVVNEVDGDDDGAAVYNLIMDYLTNEAENEDQATSKSRGNDIIFNPEVNPGNQDAQCDVFKKFMEVGVIKEMEEVEAITQIKKVDVAKKKIRKLDVTKKKIKKLDVPKKKIQKVAVTKKKIRKVDVPKKKIKILDVMKKIQTLDVTTVTNRTHPCPKCDHTFSRRDSVSRHIRNVHLKKKLPPPTSHTSTSTSTSKTHPCPKCASSFSKKDYLTRHIRNVHDKKPRPPLESQLPPPEDRRLQCPSCPKSYAKKQNLRLHRKNIHAASLLVCLSCPQLFFGEKALLKHRQLKHDVVLPTNTSTSPHVPPN